MFTRNLIEEGMILRQQTIKIKNAMIKQILLDAGVNCQIKQIDEPHSWVMQSQRIHLTDGRSLLLKAGVNPDWTEASTILSQVKATELIKSTGIPQPNIISYSTNQEEYGFLFVLSEYQKGGRLGDAYNLASKDERKQIYKSLGQAYSRIHSIENDWSGVWDGDPSKKKYPVHPAEFYRHAEIYSGSNLYLLENNMITTDLYERICSVWDKNLSYLKQRQSSLVHVSPFPWSIYMDKDEKGFTVKGVSALADFMWWDVMSDVAHLLYPPFLNISEEERNAFVQEYKLPLDERAIKLYTILNRLCAMSGCYLAPVDSTYAKTWIKEEVKTIKEILDRLEA
ncbi:phosphotransferase [Alkaliphilus transvaalensis]|uniref:phosphotransferase n=1 Tax=Alkaliphilus transvaalensis TaxID=114628 RepID=UPI00047CC060|nr:aminoglycoside phosphotransferase family protein [Alkaliphilus transvaalensis]